jgi:NAD(P)-dependent dehydrogenase (short-subunit alcohol dehydrogenase family)
MNIKNTREIHAAVDKIQNFYNRVDILVNNAGIAPENLVENVTEKDFDETIAINLKGTFL